MWHKAPCSSRDYSRVRESGPRKREEDGDDDGDVGEDDHRGDDSPPDGTPAPPEERRRGSPPCTSSSMASTLRSLAFMVMKTPPGYSSLATGDDGPLRQGAGEGPDWFFMATEACGGGTSDPISVLEVLGHESLYGCRRYVGGLLSWP